MPLALRRPEAKGRERPLAISSSRIVARPSSIAKPFSPILLPAPTSHTARPVPARQQRARPVVADREVECSVPLSLMRDRGCDRESAGRCRCWRRRARRRSAPCRTVVAAFQEREVFLGGTVAVLVAKSEMRLAFFTIAPDRRCTMFWMMARGNRRAQARWRPPRPAIAVGQNLQPTGMFEPARKGTHLEGSGGLGRLAIPPGFACHRPVDGRQPTVFRRRDRRLFAVSRGHLLRFHLHGQACCEYAKYGCRHGGPRHCTTLHPSRNVQPRRDVPRTP